MRALAAIAAVAFVGSAQQLTPMRFAPAPGWHVGHGRVDSCPGKYGQQCAQAGSWAATTKWRDCAECNPPHRTLVALAPGGVAISVLVGTDGTARDRRLAWPPRLRRRDARGPVEGGPPKIGFDARFGRLNGVETYLYVFYGRRHPSKAQVARAQAELDSARLPSR